MTTIESSTDYHTLNLLKSLKLPEHSSWTTVYDKARSKGETVGYAQFLANEYCRLHNIERDVIG